MADRRDVRKFGEFFVELNPSRRNPRQGSQGGPRHDKRGRDKQMRCGADEVVLSREDIEPLETGAWLGQLKKLASSNPHNDESLVRSLRQSFYLTQLAGVGDDP